MRLQYIDNPPSLVGAEEQEIVENIKEARGPLGLLPVDLTLLHAPEFARGTYKLVTLSMNRTDSLP